VVVTVVGMDVQHAAESQSPAAHTVLSEFLEYPSPQLKPAQVGSGVVVTVVTTGGGVVVTVVMRTAQHVAESHLPI